MLKCSMCIQFNEKLRGMRNYNPVFVVGSKNLRVSSYEDHAPTDVHQVSNASFKVAELSLNMLKLCTILVTLR